MSQPLSPEVAVFAAALELPADQRGAYLDQTCAGNAQLRAQVEALLQVHDEAGSFFDKLSPAPQAALREGAIPAEKPGPHWALQTAATDRRRGLWGGLYGRAGGSGSSPGRA